MERVWILCKFKLVWESAKIINMVFRPSLDFPLVRWISPLRLGSFVNNCPSKISLTTCVGPMAAQCLWIKLRSICKIAVVCWQHISTESNIQFIDGKLSALESIAFFTAEIPSLTLLSMLTAARNLRTASFGIKTRTRTTRWGMEDDANCVRANFSGILKEILN